MRVVVTAELENGRIICRFPYSPEVVEAIKQVPGRRFVPAEKGGPHWSLPADLDVARRLRAELGKDGLRLGPALREWGRSHVAEEKKLMGMAVADSAELKVLPNRLPALYQALHLGPKGKDYTPEERELAMQLPGSFQTADVAFMVEQLNPLNGNQPGLGKTLETIGAVFEAANDKGAHLVVAPVSAVETVWATELALWQDLPVFAPTGNRAQREEIIEEFLTWVNDFGEDAWLVVNPEMIAMKVQPCEAHGVADDDTRKHCAECVANWWARPELAHLRNLDLDDYHAEAWDVTPLEDRVLKARPCKSHDAAPSPARRGCPACVKVPHYPELHEIEWSNVIIDEAHKVIRNVKNMSYLGARNLKVKEGGKHIALTGTPMGGKPVNLFGLLQFLNPSQFTSKWNWARQWTEVTSNGYGQSIGGIRRCPTHFAGDEGNNVGCLDCQAIEQEFYKSMSRYMVRRLKSEVLTWLPAKQHVDVWVPMTDTQRKQYDKMATDSEIRLSELEVVTATNILSEYLRLKQFSNARHVADGEGRLKPTTDSGKLLALEEKLEELGIMTGESDQQAIVFTQFTEFADLLYDYFNNKKKVPCLLITGKINGSRKRMEAQQKFQRGEARIMIMNTTAGGVAITLDRADTVHFMDHTWDPDDQEQAEDRAHRASRIHQVTIYNYHSEDSIESYIKAITDGKSDTNRALLDAWRTDHSSL